MSRGLLEVNNLHTYHGSVHVLHGVSLNVMEGELVALIGANGAGKSTLLGTLAGLYPSRQGGIFLGGRSIVGLPAETVVTRGLSLVPERRQIFNSLTVMDNLLLGAYRRGRQGLEEDLKQVVQFFPVLASKKKQWGGTLSGGEQQMLAIGRGLMARPRLLLLDEPSLGLAPLVVREIFTILASLKEQGTTVLLVEQNARAALRVADRAYVMERGEIVLEGTPQELLDRPQVQSAYLGRGYSESVS